MTPETSSVQAAVPGRNQSLPGQERLLTGRFLPYALSRSMEAAIPQAAQIVVALVTGSSEGGRFFPLLAIGMILSALADLGASRAFPALAGARPEDSHPVLREMLGWRWLAAGFAGAGLLLVPSGLLQQWGVSAGSKWALLIYMTGRTQVTACQGFCHGRADFRALMAGSICQAVVLALSLAGLWWSGGLSAETALASMALAAWAGALLLHDPRAWPGGPSFFLRLPQTSAGRSAARKLFPLAWASVTGSLYPRLDALIGGVFLAPSALGIYALVDASYRLLLTPGGMIAQAVFPDLRAAAGRRSADSLQAVLGRYFRLSGLLGAGINIIGMAGALYLYAGDPGLAPLLLAFAASIPVSIPNSILPPLWLSMGWEDEWAVYAVSVTALRLFVGTAACAWWGAAGLAWTHFALEMSACAVFWLIWRRRCAELKTPASSLEGT